MSTVVIVIIVFTILCICAIAGYFIFKATSNDETSESKSTSNSTSEEASNANDKINNTSSNSNAQNVTNNNTNDKQITTNQSNKVVIPLSVISNTVTSSSNGEHVFNYIFDNNTSTYWQPKKQSEPAIIRFRLTTTGGLMYKPTAVKLAVMGDTTHDPKKFILSVSDKSKVFNVRTGAKTIQTFTVTDMPASNQFDIELGVLDNNESPAIRLFSLMGIKQ